MPTRLRAVLRSIYLREHAVSMDKHKSAGKREVKKYVESLEGIVPFVSSRLLLLSFESHGVPVDEQLRSALAKHEICEPQMELVDLGTWLGSQIKAEDAVGAHFALQEWAEKYGSGSSGSSGKSADAPHRSAKSSVK